MVQVVLSDEEPAQFAPPLDGAGLLQSLDRAWFPLPQVTLQDPHVVHAPQLPARKKDECKYKDIRILESPNGSEGLSNH